MNQPIINSRADLDALAGTLGHLPALLAIHGAATIRRDVAEYPEGYGEPGYEGEPVEPTWQDGDDDSVLDRLGLTRAELAALIAASG